MKGTDWNNNGRIDAGDWYIDYEIMNEDSEKNCSHTKKPKKKKAPVSEEQLEANGRFLRKFFIVLGIIFSVLILEENIRWYRFDPSYAHLWEVLLSIVILIVIACNIWRHRKRRKKGD